MSKILLVKSPIKKSRDNVDINYDTPIKKSEYKNLTRELKVKVGRNFHLSLILRKNGTAVLVKIPFNCKTFYFEGNTFFNVKSGAYLWRKNVISIFIEGSVLPIEHRYVTYVKHNILLYDRFGKPVKEIEGDDISADEISEVVKDNEGNLVRNDEGYIVKKTLDRIKGLEFDSVIASAIFNSGLIEKLGKGGKPDKFLFWVFLFLIINLIMSCCAIGLIYTK